MQATITVDNTGRKVITGVKVVSVSEKTLTKSNGKEYKLLNCTFNINGKEHNITAQRTLGEDRKMPEKGSWVNVYPSEVVDGNGEIKYFFEATAPTIAPKTSDSELFDLLGSTVKAPANSEAFAG